MYHNSLTVLQHARSENSTAPLILLHDGSGVISSYKALGHLNRDVYGLANPRFESGLAWEGGIPEMAQSYARMIKAQIPSGNILLGGWSFGGFLAMELSRVFAEDSSLHVTGIILIDTFYPKTRDGDVLPGISQMPELAGVRPRIRAQIHKSIQHVRTMLDAWSLPEWNANSMAEDYDYPDRVAPPPTVLLRAANPLPTKPGQALSVPPADIFRHDLMLGWGEYPASAIQMVWSIAGNHFSLFDAPYLKKLTERLQDACTYLDADV